MKKPSIQTTFILPETDIKEAKSGKYATFPLTRNRGRWMPLLGILRDASDKAAACMDPELLRTSKNGCVHIQCLMMPAYRKETSVRLWAHTVEHPKAKTGDSINSDLWKFVENEMAEKIKEAVLYLSHVNLPNNKNKLFLLETNFSNISMHKRLQLNALRTTLEEKANRVEIST
jgi:hypothetical protein